MIQSAFQAFYFEDSHSLENERKSIAALQKKILAIYSKRLPTVMFSGF